MKTKGARILLLAILFILIGTISVSAILLSGEEGMRFDGLSEYKTASCEMPLPLTYEATVRFPEALTDAGGVIFGNYYTDKTASINFEIGEGGAPRVLIINSSKVKYDITFNTISVYNGEKTHIAVTLDAASGTATCYVNGVAKERKTVSIPTGLTVNSSFAIGGDHPTGTGNHFKGELFGLMLYSDIRTADEIAADAKDGEIDKSELITGYAPLTSASEGRAIASLGDAAYNLTYKCDWIKDLKAPKDYAYSFAVIGDIQSMTYYYPDYLVEQYEWIRDNAAEKKIAFSIGLGDITETNTDAEYQKVLESYDKIDGVIPFSIIRGNHESVAMYDKYITKEKYGDEITGSYDGTMKNTYRIMQIGKVRYMFMNLDLTLSEGAIEWANETIASHPECHVIVSTHAYKNMGGSYLTLATSGKFGVETDSVVFWDKLVSQHENIVMLLYGHSPKDTIWKKQRNDTVHGNTVTEMLINPSETDKNNGGCGLVTMFYFSEDGEHLDVQYYSTVKGAYFKTENQFSLELDTPGTVEPDTSDATFTSVIMNVGASESERNLTWYSQYDAAGEVRYAKSTDGKMPESYHTASAVATKAVKEGAYVYKATIKGLEANSTYVYQLVVGGTASECYTFKTYGMGDDFSFAFVTDPQVKEYSHSIAWDDTLNKILSEFGDISLIVSAGDQTQEPSSEDNFDWFISEHLASVAIATTNGPPHDNSQLYKDHYNLPNMSTKYGVSTTTSDYFYTYNNVLFMHLNVENSNYDGHIEFMENAIADNPDCLWRVVLLHFSFFSGGNHSTDGSVINFRKALAGKFCELGVDVVLSGHDHVYSRSHMMLDGYTVSGDVVTGGVVTDPVGTLYICGTSSTASGWYNKEHTTDDAYIAQHVDDNRKSVVIFTVSEGALTLKTYFVNGATPEQYDSFTIKKSKAPVRLDKDTDMLKLLVGTSRIPLINAYGYNSCIVKTVDGYVGVSTDGGRSFTSLGIASTDTKTILRTNAEGGYWELSEDGGASFRSIGVSISTYTVKFVTLPGTAFGDATDLTAFNPRRFTSLSPDAPVPVMPRGTLGEGKLYSWDWVYYLEGGDGTQATVFEYGKSYIAYPVSTEIPIASTIYLDTVSSPSEYTYTWGEVWEIIRSCPRERMRVVLKNDITLTPDDAVIISVPINLTLDLGGHRLDTSAIGSAIKLSVGSNGSSFTLVTSLVGGTLNAGLNNLLELGTNQGSKVSVKFGTPDTKPLTVESISYLVYPNGNFKYTSTLNLDVYGGVYNIARGVIYVNNVTTSASYNIYKIYLKDAAFNFFGSESSLARPKSTSYFANVLSTLVAEGCTFTDTYKPDHSSSRGIMRNDIWKGEMSFVACDFVGMSVGKDHTGVVYESPASITIGRGCTFTNSQTSFNTGALFGFISPKVTLAVGTALARTDARGSAEVVALADAVEITWDNPVGYKEYWKSGATPSYLGESTFTVGDKTYSLVLIESPTVANENKAYSFKSAEGYLYRYDATSDVWQISTDGGVTYTNITEAGGGTGNIPTPDPEPKPEVGCTLTVDGVSTTFTEDTDFYTVLSVVNTSSHAGKEIKIVLSADMSFKTAPTYNRAATIIIDLAGHKLTYEADGRFKIAATKLHIYSSVMGGEFVFSSGDGFQPSSGAIVFGSEEYKNCLAVSSENEILNPAQTADGKTLHYEFLYSTINTGKNSLIRVNAKGAGAITLEMKFVGCTVTGDKSIICYNYSATLTATSNGGVCNANSYIDAIDTSFVCNADEPIGFFGGPNFTDRYFGTASFKDCTFKSFILNGELIYSDEALSYNSYYDSLAGMGYDPRRAITVGGGCVFYNYGTTFTEDLSGFAAINTHAKEGSVILYTATSVLIVDKSQHSLTDWKSEGGMHWIECTSCADGVKYNLAKCEMDESLEPHVCKICGMPEDAPIVPPTGHTYEAVVTPPTCTERGFTTYTCTECGDTYVDNYVTAKGHSYGEWAITKNPDCTEPGERKRGCTECDAALTEPIDPTGHSEVSHEGKAATCTEVGYDAYVTCTKCDFTTYSEIPIIPHDMRDATCDAPKTCKVCGSTEGEALGHEWQDATCDAPKTCGRCGKTDGDKLPGGNTGDDGDRGEPEISHDECVGNFFEIIWNAIVNFFRRLFGMPEICICGKEK